MKKFLMNWECNKIRPGVRYECGFCGTDTSPSIGWKSVVGNQNNIGYVLICTYCNKPSFIEAINDRVLSTTPAAKLGNEVAGLTDDIQALYDEARKSTSVGAYTSAVLTCRKILMHVAVQKGAEEGNKFIEYVDYLLENNYIPPDGRNWVDYIRTKSNEANHEIVIMKRKDADDLITFTEMLLRLIYEFPDRLTKDVPDKDDK